MIGVLSRRLREESGQSLVFFVLLMSTFFAMAALVVNVGNWLQAKRHLQAVTDSAALSAAQEDPRRHLRRARELPDLDGRQLARELGRHL